MNREAQGGVLLVVGIVTLRLALTDAHLSYVKSGMKVLLVGAAVVLLVVGVTALWRVLRRGEAAAEREETALVVTGRPPAAAVATGGDPASRLAAPDRSAVRLDAHGHAHAAGGPRVGWLLLVPVFALVLIAPDPLGAYAAGRQTARVPEPATVSFPALAEPTDGAVDLAVSEFVTRALYDRERSLEGVPVRLLGFVAHATDTDGYLLTRFVMTCCAADAFPVQVRVRGVPPPAVDTWVEVVGMWEPEPLPPGVGLATVKPALQAEQQRPVAAPAQPYEY